jgi:hypothetical protein
MLISMPTGTSTIFGVFQAIKLSPLAPAGRLPHQATIEPGSKQGKQTLNACVLEMVPTGLAKRCNDDKNDDKNGPGLAN